MFVLTGGYHCVIMVIVMEKRKEKEKALFIYARHLLADGTKPTDPLEKKPVRLIISIFTFVYGCAV